MCLPFEHFLMIEEPDISIKDGIAKNPWKKCFFFAAASKWITADTCQAVLYQHMNP
jgi:hypothetical protein